CSAERHFRNPAAAARNPMERARQRRGLLSPVGNGMQPCQFVERQMRFRIAQREANNDILTADLPPEPIRRPFLRHGPAQALDPDKIPFRHGSTSWRLVRNQMRRGLVEKTLSASNTIRPRGSCRLLPEFSDAPG